MITINTLLIYLLIGIVATFILIPIDSYNRDLSQTADDNLK